MLASRASLSSSSIRSRSLSIPQHCLLLIHRHHCLLAFRPPRSQYLRRYEARLYRLHQELLLPWSSVHQIDEVCSWRQDWWCAQSIGFGWQLPESRWEDVEVKPIGTVLSPLYYNDKHYAFHTWYYFCWSQDWFYLFCICFLVSTNRTKLKYIIFLFRFYQNSSLDYSGEISTGEGKFFLYTESFVIRILSIAYIYLFNILFLLG